MGGDRLKFLGKEFRELSQAAPRRCSLPCSMHLWLVWRAPLLGSCDEVKAGTKIEVPKATKIIVYAFAVAGRVRRDDPARKRVWRREGLPHFSEVSIDWFERALIIPLR